MFAAIRRRLTFSNVIALIALFVALGGSAYAVKKINGKKLVKNSVTGKKLKKNTITGREVNEAKLGAIANATNAANAAALGGKTAADFQPAGSILQSGLVKLQVGEERVIATRGPFSFRLVCRNDGGEVEGVIFFQSSEAPTYSFDNPVPAGQDIEIVGGTESGPGFVSYSYYFLTPTTSITIAHASVWVNQLGAPCSAELTAL